MPGRSVNVTALIDERGFGRFPFRVALWFVGRAGTMLGPSVGSPMRAAKMPPSAILYGQRPSGGGRRGRDPAARPAQACGAGGSCCSAHPDGVAARDFPPRAGAFGA